MALSRRTLAFIHAFIAVQIAMPIYYYAGRADKNDERFAWRMFSPTRMLKCRPGFRVESESDTGPGKQVTLVGRERSLGDFDPGAFHEAWVTIAQRGRVEVIEAMADALCERNPGSAVYVSSPCRSVDGSVRDLSSGAWDFCKVGSL